MKSDAAEGEQRDLRERFSSRRLLRARLRRRLWVGLIVLARRSERAFDLLLGAILLLALSPLALPVLLYTCRQPEILRRATRRGLMGKPFHLYHFNLPDDRPGRLMRSLRLDRIPVLLNVIKGDMSLVGPSPVPCDRFPLSDPAARKRLEIRPGLIGLWGLRNRTNIAFDSELATDVEYVDGKTLRGDFGLLLRFLITLLYGRHAKPSALTLEVLGIPLANLDMRQAVSLITERLSQDGPFRVCFTNPHCANVARADARYMETLRSADLNLADGIGMKIAGRILGLSIAQNVNGTDLFPRLCASMSGTGRRVFLLGGRPGVPEDVRDWMSRHYPGVEIAGWHHGYFTSEEEPEVIGQIARSEADLLLVAFGVPLQDKWLADHLEATRARVGIGVGGLFDFYSGRIPRAPQWLRELGLEWTYRIWQEPGRMWKRYLVGNLVFLYRVLLQRSGLLPSPRSDLRP